LAKHLTDTEIIVKFWACANSTSGVRTTKSLWKLATWFTTFQLNKTSEKFSCQTAITIVTRKDTKNWPRSMRMPWKFHSSITLINHIKTAIDQIRQICWQLYTNFCILLIKVTYFNLKVALISFWSVMEWNEWKCGHTKIIYSRMN